MAERPTICDLMQYGEIRGAHLAAAVDTYFRAPQTTAYAIGGAHVVDLAKAIRSSAEARLILADDTVPDSVKRAAVRTAILLAQPVKG
ncbi:hypothetical protein [Methylobacterium iners]|uniref:Uncharacterized protein n=1 Tax=Methylobacterium iners TaxID=418707 RepID=A0ABQ4S665_9HYPH|nr:hypothetical protein [Methylobacterium iners]GJD97308.1 hypothetical protein OCOJLMKI_4537 [Methylobacterium iners]